jgi:hypothetical protein
MTPEPRKRKAVSVTVSVLCLLVLFSFNCYGQTPTPTPAPSTCSPPAACPKLAPRIIQITAIYKKGDQPLEPADKVTQLARKRFFLSSCPFNLDKLQGVGNRAPSRALYYASIKASPQLIEWLEANNCDTVYCRELKRDEVACIAQGSTKCVPEFTSAYQEALRKLKNEELARKFVTNYAPLSEPELRVGFHKEKMRWLEATRAAAEKASGLPAGAIRSAMTDRRGMAYFYDLCPGTYYISSLAPIEIDGEQFVWETTAITIKAPRASEPDQLSVTPVFLSNVASKKKRANFFIGKRVTQGASASLPRRSSR